MADTITRQEADEMMTIVRGIRDRAEKFDKASADFTEYQKKAEEDLKKFDEQIENFVKAEEKARKENEELTERLQHLELLASTTKQNGDRDGLKVAHEIMQAIVKKNWIAFANENPVEAKAYMDGCLEIIEKGVKELPPESKRFQNIIGEYKANNDILRTDIAEVGGVLCPPEWATELLRQIVEVSPIRNYAKVTSIGSKSMLQPIRQGVPTASWEGETEEGGDSTSNYTEETMTPHRLTVTVPITWDMLNDNKYNVSEELMADARIAFAQAEGDAFVRGDAIKKPLGFTVDPDVPQFDSATSTLTFDDVINITGELKSGYAAIYGFNRRTLVYLRTLKDQNDRYLWSGPFGDSAAGPAATINGYRYTSEMIDMDDYDVDNGFPIIYADFLRFYKIVDRVDMIMIRDEYSLKKKAIVEFTFMRWTDGMPVIKEAGILLKKIA